MEKKQRLIKIQQNVVNYEKIFLELEKFHT